MTIGQTIAAERRKLGLSQEQLGEKMGVTRQSISKWESDAALPELEKLIALSRLFRMPVGQLLGIEEPAAPETESAPAPEPVEVQQLAERIAGEYLRQQPKPRRWPRWVSLALIIGLGLGLWQTSQRLSNLEQNYWSLQSSLGALRSSVSQLQDLPSSIRQLLEEQASLTLSQSAQITTVDLAEGTATFALSARPKEYRQDYSALFYALDGQGERTEIPASYDGTRITAELTVPLSQSAEIYLTLRAPDGTETSQLVDWFPALYSSTTCPPLSPDSGLIFQDCVAGTPCTLRNRGSITCTVPNQPELADVMTQEVHAATVRAELWQDGKKLADCLPVPAAEDLPLPEGGATAYSFQLPEIEVTMEADSWIGVVFIATDNLGRTSTNGEFFTIQDDMLIFTDDTDPIWEAIRAAQDSE